MNMSKTAIMAGLAILATGSISASALCQTTFTGTSVELESLAGRYKSSAAEDWGRGTFGRREFTFANGHWTLGFTLALDPAFEHKVFAFRTLGSYQVLGASRAAPGVYEANFREDAKFVTLLTPDPKLAEAFGLAACELEVGTEKDISGPGCALWRPVSVCPEDHDLLALDASGGLHFGARPADNDMCTADKRPTTLLSAVVKG